jgi:hypothetical protein
MHELSPTGRKLNMKATCAEHEARGVLSAYHKSLFLTWFKVRSSSFTVAFSVINKSYLLQHDGCLEKLPAT